MESGPAFWSFHLPDACHIWVFASEERYEIAPPLQILVENRVNRDHLSDHLHGGVPSTVLPKTG